MRYDEKTFNREVAYYKKILRNSTSKNIYLQGLYSRRAFLSIAPLSRATHDLGKDLFVSFLDRKKDPVLDRVWDAFEKKDDDLLRFINLADKKLKGKFKKFFRRPGLILTPGASGFKGEIELSYKTGWFKEFRAKKLAETGRTIVKNVLAPKKRETVSVGFALVPSKKDQDQPLQDYLDAFAISMSVVNALYKKHRRLAVSASTMRKTMRDEPEKISELSATLMGCEYSKNIDEPIFKAFKVVSEKLSLSDIEPTNAVFGIRGKGYHGKHHFGQMIGYPTPDKKSRWMSPGTMLYKFSWYPQSHVDPRPPQSRIGFTSTVPLDVFIDTVLIDYKEMRARNKKIKKMLDKSEKVVVKSNLKNGCNFEVGLVKPDGTRREVKGSDSDARYLLHPDFKKQGKEFGMMANIPGGEAFTTPEWFKGRIVGDVVISLDRSYMLSARNPLVIDVKKNQYKVISGQKKIIEQLNKKRNDAKKMLDEQEKSGSVPKKIIALKRKNFYNIGEFAINTNPMARLCDYLIVNEKIANMIHIALGSGFEADKASEYHTDIVIDSPRQKLDIYGVSGDKKHWIIKNGQFVI